MEERKQPGRFTLQFNMGDPQQAAAAGLLERQGRRKAQYVTSAVLHYAQGGAGGSLDMGALESLVRRLVLESLSQSTGSTGSAADQRQAPSVATPEPDESSVLSAVSNTLAAFRRG